MLAPRGIAFEKSAITTNGCWLRVYRHCPNFAQRSCGGPPCFVPAWVRDDSVLASTRGRLPVSRELPETLIDDPATMRGRPAHDHWTISASSGQHTSHY